MTEATSLNDVKEFHTTFGHPVQPQPIVPAKERCALRVSLLQEELNELKEGIENGDIVEIADALCDLQYVLSGAIIEFGLADKFSALFSEVHRSNMSKACKTKEEAEETIAFYKQKDGVEGHYVEKDNMFLVYRTVDNKTLKSIRYSPANLAELV